MGTALGHDPEKKKLGSAEDVSVLRHAVYNQLSNIYLAVEQIRHEIPDLSDDCSFYLDSILQSSSKINSLLKEID